MRRERSSDACDLGYLVTLVTDACTTSSAERPEQSLIGIRGYYRQRTIVELLNHDALTRLYSLLAAVAAVTSHVFDHRIDDLDAASAASRLQPADIGSHRVR